MPVSLGNESVNFCLLVPDICLISDHDDDDGNVSFVNMGRWTIGMYDGGDHLWSGGGGGLPSDDNQLESTSFLLIIIIFPQSLSAPLKHNYKGRGDISS